MFSNLLRNNSLHKTIVLLNNNKFNSLNCGKNFYSNFTSKLNSTKYQINCNNSFNLLLKRFKNNSENLVAKPEKIKLRFTDVKRLLSLAKSEKWNITFGIGCLIISSAITMTVPFALGKIVDIIYIDTDTADTNIAKGKLNQFCTILCGVFILGGLANFGRVYLFNNASLRITNRLRLRLYGKMMNQETGWFDTKGSGELMNRLSGDTYLIGNSLSQNLSDGLRSTVMIVAGTGMMIQTSAHLALVSLMVVPVVAGVAIIYGRYVRNITRELLDKLAEVMKVSEERLGNIKTVKIFCKENYEKELLSNKLIEALQIGYRETLAKSTFFGLTGLSGNIIIVSVLYYGGNMCNNHELTVGALTSFILYAGYTAISIGGLSSFYTELNKGIGAAARIWEIMDRQFLIPNEGGSIPTTAPLGSIVFKDISFSFPSRPTVPILKNLDLVLKPGTVTAIVGRSGSGKSTLGYLLLRLYDPLQGTVSLDGVDIKEYNPYWLRSQISAVNQEPVLFSGTIRQNILYGRNDRSHVSEHDFKRVIEKAHIDEFIQRLPQGYETIVGNRGIMLSGGQKQRVAIARALIKNPLILILDEATSALDSRSEEFINKALENLSRGRTVLTIAHRLSTIRKADSIAVLDEGRIIEQGSYGELISIEGGAFWDLVSHQTISQK